MSKRVYVAGLPSSATEEQVLKLFDRSGRIWRGVFKHGYAFLDFDTHDDARDAIKAHDGQLFLGRRLVVQWGYSQPSNEDDDRETPRRSDLSTNSIPANQRSAHNSDAEYGVTLTGLPRAAGYQELRGLVSRHCSGMKAVVLGPDVGNAAGTAHLVFDSLSMARAAMRELNGTRLRGFRIQSWGLTPEEMDNLVKAETIVDHLVRVHAPVSGLLYPAIQARRTPDVVPDTLTIIPVKSAPRVQVCRKAIGTGVAIMMRPDRGIAIGLARRCHVRVGDLPVQEMICGELAATLVTPRTEIVLHHLGGALALDPACPRTTGLVVIAPVPDLPHLGDKIGRMHLQLAHQTFKLPVRPSIQGRTSRQSGPSDEP